MGCQEPVLHSTLLHCMSLLMAQSGHAGQRVPRQLLGVKQPRLWLSREAANDPKRTSTLVRRNALRIHRLGASCDRIDTRRNLIGVPSSRHVREISLGGTL